MENAGKGLVQIYHGDGKGKTTAAVGQAVRAAGHGWKVCLVQFLKNTEYTIGERKSIERLDRNISLLIHEYSRALYVDFQVKNRGALASEVSNFLEAVECVIQSGQMEMVILDEVGTILQLGLASEERVANSILSRPQELHIVMTGREFPESILQLADLVTQFKNEKHPYDQGIQARKGIEY